MDNGQRAKTSRGKAKHLWLIVALTLTTGCDESEPKSVPSTPVAQQNDSPEEPVAPAPTPAPTAELRHTGPVAEQLGPVIKDAPAPRRIFCDPKLKRATRLEKRRDRVIVESDGYSQLVDVNRGPIGEPFERARFGRHDGRHWLSADKGIMSLEDGSHTVLGAYVHVVTGTERRGWALRRHMEITSTDAKHREVEKRVEPSLYWVIEGGSADEFPFEAGLNPGASVARGGALWARVSSDDCILARFDAAGDVSCALEASGEWRPEGMYTLGERWLVIWQNHGGGARIVDTERGELLELPGCEDFEIAEFVADPPAVSVMCKDSEKVGYWTPSTGFRPVAELPESWRMYPDPKVRFVGLHNVVGDRGGIRGQRYYDAVRGVLTESEYPLSHATRSGFLYHDGEALDANTGKTRPVDLPFCGTRWEVRDTYRHYALLVCEERSVGDTRGRPRKLTSCRSPAPRPGSLGGVLLVDLRSGISHRLNDAKPVVLSDDGLVVIRGSGHDLDLSDGTELVFQPYPEGTAPAPKEPPKNRCPSVGDRFRAVKPTGVALMGGQTHARIHIKSETVVTYADEDWVTSKRWRCSSGRFRVSGATARMDDDGRIVWDGVTFERLE